MTPSTPHENQSRVVISLAQFDVCTPSSSGLLQKYKKEKVFALWCRLKGLVFLLRGLFEGKIVCCMLFVVKTCKNKTFAYSVKVACKIL